MGKLNNRGKIAILATILIIVGFALAGLHNPKDLGKQSKRANAPTTVKLTKNEKQIIKNLNVKKTSDKENASLTSKYRKLVGSSKYTFSKPYIKVNPYKNAPLSALIIFKTDQPAKVTYKVIGKSYKTTITNHIKSYQTNHQIPIVGLYADYKNKVEITLTTKDGKTQKKTFSIQTGQLPEHIISNQRYLTNVNKDKMDIGDNKLTVLDRTSRQTYAVDADGQVRWYYLRWNEHIFEQLNNGHLLLFTKIKSGDYRYNLLVETDYLGRVYNQYAFDKNMGNSYKSKSSKGISVVHHDVCELPNGNLLLTVDDGSKYVEDTLAELDRKTGKIVNVINFKNVFPKDMYAKSKLPAVDKANQGLGLIDWLHLNDVDYDAKTGTVLLSSRNQDMIWAMDYKTKKLKWIFTSKKASSWPKEYRKYLLKPAAGTKYTGGQHALYLLKRNGNKLDVLLYNNNIAVTNGDKDTSGKYSAGVEYEIDTSKKTIKQIWSFGEELGKANFTSVIGNAQRLSNGNTLVDFGYKSGGNQSNIIEVDKNNKEVFNLTTYNSAKDKTYVYRAYRMEFYPDNYVFDLLK